MIGMTVYCDAALDALRSPLHNDRIVAGRDNATGTTQFGAQIIDAVGLFVMQTLDIVKDTFTFGETGSSHQDGNAVNCPVSIHLDTLQATPAAQHYRLAINTQISPHRS